MQSAFSLKIRLVLDLIQRDCKPRCYYYLAASGFAARVLRFCVVTLQRKIRDCEQFTILIKESTGNPPLQILESNEKLGWVYVLHDNKGNRRATDLLRFHK